MKIVITGGEGFIGKALAATLSKRGAEVIIIDRKKGIEAKDFFDTVPNLNEANCVYRQQRQHNIALRHFQAIRRGICQVLQPIRHRRAPAQRLWA